MDWLMIYIWVCCSVFIIITFTDWFDGGDITLESLFLWLVLSILPIFNIYTGVSAVFHLFGKLLPTLGEIVNYPIIKGRKRE